MDSLEIWHQKLAHQNIPYCKKVLERNGFKIEDKENVLQCESCIFGKQHRQPFYKSKTTTRKPGEVVHADLCGPMENTSIGGSRFFLLLKDDYTHYRTVYFLKHKNEVINKLKEYIPRFKMDTGEKIKVLRSDNGLEFKNQQVKEILNQYGIRQQFAVSYTPEQNGSAEREMRTLVEAARTMIHNKNLTKRFWADAINTAAYVINRSGTSSINDKTPYELYFNEKPIITNLQIFGSEVYAHISKEKTLKWERKSKKGLFVGYVCRDVIFKKLVPEAEIIVGRESLTLQNKNENEKSKEEAERVEENGINESSDNITNEENQNINDSNVSEDLTDINNINTEHEVSNVKQKRQLKPSVWLKDYVTYISEEVIEFEEAIQNERWKTAMREEIEALEKNNTWELKELVNDRNVVKNKWVYRIKPDGTYKARLVAKGYSQKHGVDYSETFSPVAQFKSIRLILGIAAARNLNIGQFDVRTAFLNGNLDEEIFMEQPKGFEDGTERVCLLKKGLYGLKQASRNWNKTF